MKLLSIIVLCTALASCAISPANHEGADAPARAAIVPLKAVRPVIGLVLGAGGARGFAHVGVLKALADAGIEADLVVGASSGALVASLYAGGYSAEQLHTLALALEDSDIFDFTFFGPGRVEGAKIARYVNHSLDNRPIEKLNKPFVAVATEQGSNTMAAFNRGNTGLAVRASASVPSVFWPVIIHGRAYVDGGVSSRVPAALAREMGADVVIAVDIASRMSNGDENAADVVIRPKVIRTRINDFKHRQSNIAAGEEAGRAAIAEIRTHMRAVAARK